MRCVSNPCRLRSSGMTAASAGASRQPVPLTVPTSRPAASHPPWRTHPGARTPPRGARTLARAPRGAHGPRAPLTAGLACPTVPQPTARSEAPDGRLVLGKPGIGELRNSAGYRYLRHVPSARRPKNPCKGRKRSMSAGQTMRRTTANEDRSRQGGVRRVPTRAPIQASASGFALRQPGVTTRGGPRLNGECGAGDECR